MDCRKERPDMERYNNVIPFPSDEWTSESDIFSSSDVTSNQIIGLDDVGVHRGILASLGNEEREALINEQMHKDFDIVPHLLEMLNEAADKGPVERDLRKLLRAFKKDFLTDFASALEIKKYSSLKKDDLADLIASSNDELFPFIEESISDMRLGEFKAFRYVYEQGGVLNVEESAMSLPCGLPPTDPFLIRLFKSNGVFTFAIPDQVMSICDETDFDSIGHLIQEVDGFIHFLNFSVELCGIVDLDDALDEFERRFPDGPTFEEAMRALLPPDEDTCFFRILTVEEKNYLLHDDIAEEMFQELSKQQIPKDSDYSIRSREAAEVGWIYEGKKPKIVDYFLKSQQGKPAFFPTDEMLENQTYLEWACKEPASMALIKFLDAHVPDGENDYYFADRIIEELIDMTHGGYKIGDYMNYLSDSGVVLDLDGTKTLLNLVARLSNGLPLWENNGWKPDELFQKTTGRKLFYNEDGSIRKVGRNDPCPCGSGKKYKNCCGRSVPSN